MPRPRESKRLQAERAYVERTCVGEICARCHATLATFGTACAADLDDACPGFMAIEAARQAFNRNPAGPPIEEKL